MREKKTVLTEPQDENKFSLNFFFFFTVLPVWIPHHCERVCGKGKSREVLLWFMVRESSS